MSSVYAVLGGRPIGRSPAASSGYPGSSPGLPANLSPCRRRTCRFPPIPISPVPTKNLGGQPPEVIRTACPSPFGTIRRASVLPQKTKVRIANGHTARSAFPHERLQASLRSGSFARVKVMQAADFRNLDHLTERRKLDRSADGRIFFERQMRTASFVVFEIILQNPAQPGLMENNDVIQAFATDGAQQSFRKGILPRRSRRSQVWLANCYGRGDFTGNRAAQVNWLSLSERIRW